MNIVNFGKQYQIYGEEVKTGRTLPAETFEVRFSKMSGFSLMKRDDLALKEEKVYGCYPKKVGKVLNSFEHTDRNLGIILSGPKGVGKSMFARILMNEAMNKNIPVLIVTEYVPGIADFLSSIKQEVAVLFDEFEKTFKANKEYNPQDEMLPLFDGIDSGKKLFVITCNETSKLSEYLMNRPGRFHYHFELKAPNAREIKEYMMDKLEKKDEEIVDTISKLGMMSNMTYDCLRAISFDLNLGYSLQETLSDLNVNESDSRYLFTIHFEDGAEYTCSKFINLLDVENNMYLNFQLENGLECNVSFLNKVIQFTNNSDYFIVHGADLDIYYEEYDSKNQEIVNKMKERKAEFITIKRHAFSKKLVV